MRIRSIKPEFWISESIGRLSRDARLLFIGLWSFADDSGRSRGAFAAISGALFPYDSDANKHLPRWISELEKEGMIKRYIAQDGNTYIEIPNWLKHQKIEKPSKSKFPAIPEHSTNIPRILPDISALEQGTGNREQGPMEQGNREPESSGAAPPSIDPESEWKLEHGIAIPGPLRTRQCIESAREWLAYKKEIKTPYKPTGLRNAVAIWAKEFTSENFPAAVQRSIASGWKGIYGEKPGTGTNGGSNHRGNGADGNPRNAGIAGFDEWHRDFQARAVGDGQHGPWDDFGRGPEVAGADPEAGRVTPPTDSPARASGGMAD